MASGNNLSVQAEVSLWEMRQSQCEVEAADAGCQQLDLKIVAVRRRWSGAVLDLMVNRGCLLCFQK